MSKMSKNVDRWWREMIGTQFDNEFWWKVVFSNSEYTGA